MDRRCVTIGLLGLAVLVLSMMANAALAADEVCLACHQALTPQQVTDWRNSNHAKSLETLKADPEATDACLQCHSADYRANPDLTLETAQFPNSCSTCHLDHVAEGRPAGDKTTHELRAAKKDLCVDCHSAQGAKPGEVPRSAQVEIFRGTGGAGVPDSPGVHSLIMPDGCVTCHLSDHTFRADLQVCSQCHAEGGEAKAAQAKDVIEGQLAELQPLLESYPDKDAQAYKEAKFNIDLVRISGDEGVHNFSYSKALLDYAASVLKEAPVEPQPKEESCFACHRALTPNQVTSWEASAHARSLEDLKASPDAEDACLQCHSLDYRQDPQNVTLETAALPNSCGTCHIDHVSEGRPAGDKTTHELVAAKKEMCISCHTAGDAQPGETPPASQYQIFTGTGGAEVPDMPGTHSLIMQDGCLTCHAGGQEGTTDHQFEVEDFSVCSTCHPDAEAFYNERKAQITGLIEQVDALLADADTTTEAYRKAKFNYDLVVRSHDYGAHNFKYSKALLEKSVELLTPSVPEYPNWDVNKDGTVDVLDLVIIGTNFGLTIEGAPDPNPDVNRDGVVDVLDLVVVGLHFGEKTVEQPAAPIVAAVPNSRLWLEVSPVQDGYLTVNVQGAFGAAVTGFQFDLAFDASQLELIGQMQGNLLPAGESYWHEGSVAFGQVRGIAATRLNALETFTRRATLASLTFRVKRAATVPTLRLTAARLVNAQGQLLPVQIGAMTQVVPMPRQTRLLANYPNPFNPETWIPYQLAEPADVTLEIYSASGQRIRTIHVGSQPAGYHLNRDEAIYWDGRTDTGERAASGVYYYRLKAGDYAEMRKMVILK